MKMIALLFAAALTAHAGVVKFSAQDIDKTVKTGYDVEVADVDGDKLADILLADAREVFWYKNPGKRGAQWLRYVAAENFTIYDNVGIAAEDIDGDGKCDVAISAMHPLEATGGTIVYLVPPVDRTQKWEPVRLPNVQPALRRVRWMKLGGKHWGLLALSQRENRAAAEINRDANLVFYKKPDELKTEWPGEVILASTRRLRGFDTRLFDNNRNLVRIWGDDGFGSLYREEDGRIVHIPFHYALGGGPQFRVGELREGSISRQVLARDKVVPVVDWKFTATIEPFLGNQLVVLALHNREHPRHVLTEQLNVGTALECGDLTGTGRDQIIVGSRGDPARPKSGGIRVWTGVGNSGSAWLETVVDEETACEDLALADFDGDGKIDIVAAGRATHNLRILWNER